MKLDTLEHYLLHKGHSSSSIKRILAEIHLFENWLASQGLSIGMTGYKDITAFMEHLNQKGNSQRTVAHYINALKHFYAYHIQTGEVQHNYPRQIKVQGTKQSSVYQILSKEELEYLYNSYPKEETTLLELPMTPTESRNKALLSLLIFQGLSTTDLKALQTTDISTRKGKVCVPKSKKINSRKLDLNHSQILDMQEYLLQTRTEILKERNQQTDTLIVGYYKGQRTIQNILQKLLPELQKILPQLESFRHIRASVITHWTKQNNLREVQYMAGHRFISSTEAYLNNDIETLQTEFERYSPIF